MDQQKQPATSQEAQLNIRMPLDLKREWMATLALEGKSATGVVNELASRSVARHRAKVTKDAAQVAA